MSSITIMSSNGRMLKAPAEVWIISILSVLSAPTLEKVFAHAERLKDEQRARPGQVLGSVPIIGNGG
jgi:hypothetical protein